MTPRITAPGVHRSMDAAEGAQPILASRREGSVTIWPNLTQGCDEWLEVRRGLLTASEMDRILTPTLKVAANDKARMHLWEIMAQRISGFVEPSYIGDEMLRGWDDEIEARRIYSERIAPVEDVGFMTNDRWGFTIGYSPDGLVGVDGLIEVKSRRQKFQVQAIADGWQSVDFGLQVQTGLLVSERSWLDFISYSGGLPMAVFRVYPDDKVKGAIIDAATEFEAQVAAKMAAYHKEMRDPKGRFFPTERRVEEEMRV